MYNTTRNHIPGMQCNDEEDAMQDSVLDRTEVKLLLLLLHT